MISTPAIVAAASATADTTAVRRVCPDASITDAIVNPSGTLCRMIATKIIHPRVFDSTNPEARRALVAYSLGNFVSAMYTRECLQSCIFNLNYVRQNKQLILGSVSYLPTFCSKTHKGESSSRVVSILDELRKECPSGLKKELVAGLRGITEHLGKAFLIEC